MGELGNSVGGLGIFQGVRFGRGGEVYSVDQQECSL